jgi:hypothetical protein
MRPLVPSDLWTPSERLIHALGRAAYAAAHGDTDAVRTLRLIFGTELLGHSAKDAMLARDLDSPEHAAPKGVERKS